MVEVSIYCICSYYFIRQYGTGLKTALMNLLNCKDNLPLSFQVQYVTFETYSYSVNGKVYSIPFNSVPLDYSILFCSIPFHSILFYSSAVTGLEEIPFKRAWPFLPPPPPFFLAPFFFRDNIVLSGQKYF